jgi:AbrB family looped-hinge helix DNA binding protein
MEHTATVTSKGQITIPREVRRALHLRKGDTVVFEVHDGEAHMRPRHPPDIFLRYAGVLREGQGRSVADIVAEVRELRGEPQE